MTQDLCGGSPRELPEKVLEVVGALDDREDERAVAGGGDGLVASGAQFLDPFFGILHFPDFAQNDARARLRHPPGSSLFKWVQCFEKNY
jgi:hypothetical protein